MRSWQEDQLEALLSVRCERTLFKSIVSIARELGFEHCAYGIRAPFPFSKPRVVMLNTYPAAWQARYREMGYLNIDPTVRHGAQSPLPVIWSEKVFASVPELWEDARSFGLCVGWAQSSRDANGVGGLLTLARSYEPLSHAELNDKQFKMTWLAQVAHIGMSRCLGPRLLPETGVQLTCREVGVLRWTAEGKTSSEISTILNISERTVNFHINNAVMKLNASNKTAAAVRAAALGLLN